MMNKEDIGKSGNYPCRYPDCYRLSEYFAINNIPKFGHLCRVHYQYCTKIEKLYYDKADF